MDDILAAIVDTILPGSATAPAVPTGSQAGVRIDTGQPAASVVLQAIAERSGSPEAFARADEARRIAVLEAVERDHPAPFRAVVTALLQDYYETEAVLIAFGAFTEPLQPGGRPVAPTEPSTLDLLDSVRARGAIWRACS